VLFLVGGLVGRWCGGFGGGGFGWGGSVTVLYWSICCKNFAGTGPTIAWIHERRNMIFFHADVVFALGNMPSIREEGRLTVWHEAWEEVDMMFESQNIFEGR